MLSGICEIQIWSAVSFGIWTARYDGRATDETFNCKGDTDILTRSVGTSYWGRARFGRAQVQTDAINQFVIVICMRDPGS